MKNDINYVLDIEELLESGKIKNENYNKLLENTEYKKAKEECINQLQELQDSIDRIMTNPFLLAKELILCYVIYPLMIFINKFKKG